MNSDKKSLAGGSGVRSKFGVLADKKQLEQKGPANRKPKVIPSARAPSTPTGIPTAAPPPKKITPATNRHPVSTRASELRRNLYSKNVSQLEETLKIKNDVHSIKEEIMRQEENIKLLRKSLEEKDSLIQQLEKGTSDLQQHVKKLQEEKHKNIHLLEEELGYRKKLESEAQSQISEIKCTYECKLEKLNEEMKLKAEINKGQQELIHDLDNVAKDLRQEIITVREENRGLKGKECEIQGNASKKYRGSISIIQSQVSGRVSELEKRIEEMEILHVKELQNKNKEQAKIVEDLKTVISKKESELQEFKRKQKESRKSISSYLDEVDFKSNDVENATKLILQLKSQLSSAKEEITQLEKDRDLEEEYSLQAQVLEAQLEQTMKMNDGLSAKLEMAKRDTAERDGRIGDLDSIVKELQKSLEISEKQKQELVEKAHQHVNKNWTGNPMENEAVKLLQEQLGQCQSKYDDTKESLVLERLKMKELQDKLNQVEREHGLSKVDVRVLNREKNNLEQQVSKISEELKKNVAELETTREENAKQIKKIKELETVLQDSKTKGQKSTENEQIKQKTLEEARTEINRLETLNKTFGQEIASLRLQQEQHEVTKTCLIEQEKMLEEKDALLRENQRKIESLKMSLAILKETSNTLESQLQEFENAFSKKLEECEYSESQRVKLATENSTLKEQSKKLAIELNEAKSLKMFVERKLKDTERSEDQATDEMNSLKQKLEQAETKNRQLTLDVKNSKSQVEFANSEKMSFDRLYKHTKYDNDDLSSRLSEKTTLLADLKDTNTRLKAALQEAVEKAEHYQRRYEILTSANELFDSERIEREVQKQQTIQQQEKLIAFLQKQNDQLIKKKEKKFSLFSIGKDENATPNNSKSKKVPHCASGISTPKNLVHEHNVVRSLEEKAADLKNQLAILQQNSDKCQVNFDDIPSPSKEECILLKSPKQDRNH